MAAAVDMCVVMRREGKGTGQMTDPQCMVHTAPAKQTPPPTELQIPATVTTLQIILVNALAYAVGMRAIAVGAVMHH